uniref:Uncharacterized protein n=1 Tax=Klebsiella pneumoniae TaxID=573 RepID=A0A2P1BP50_KLEPN|nr:hypothetical protein [Klebsiella pneumoniae]
MPERFWQRAPFCRGFSAHAGSVYPESGPSCFRIRYQARQEPPGLRWLSPGEGGRMCLSGFRVFQT